MFIKKLSTIILLLILILSSHGQAQNQSPREQVKIGLLTPLTGALGSFGQTFENAAKLAIQDLNLVSDNYRFVLEVQDTQTSSTGAVNAMTALAKAGVIGVVGAASSSFTLAAMPVARDNKIAMVSYASTAPSISTADDDDFLFRVVPSDAFQGQVAAQLAFTELGLSNIAVIGINDAYGQGLAGAFISAFEGKGGIITDNIGYEITNQDFSPQISQITPSDPDGIFMVSFFDDGALLLDSIAEEPLLSDVKIIGTGGIASNEMFGSVKTAENFNNTYGVAPQIASSEAFQQRYNIEYGIEASVFVEHAYDATMTIGHALISAGEASSCLVADHIRGAVDDFSSVTGVIEFDANGDRVSPAIYEFWIAEAMDTTQGVITTFDQFTVTGPGVPNAEPIQHCIISDPTNYTTSNVNLSSGIPSLDLELNFWNNFEFVIGSIMAMNVIIKKKSKNYN